jgi:hypothetical protein
MIANAEAEKWALTEDYNNLVNQYNKLNDKEISLEFKIKQTDFDAIDPIVRSQFLQILE